jgi:peptide/nickel transport system substrate-binding protein
MPDSPRLLWYPNRLRPLKRCRWHVVTSSVVLEAAQVEVDPNKSRALYATFKSLVETDLPRITLISPDAVLLTSKRVNGVLASAEGIYGNFASATLAPA